VFNPAPLNPSLYIQPHTKFAKIHEIHKQISENLIKDHRTFLTAVMAGLELRSCGTDVKI